MSTAEALTAASSLQEFVDSVDTSKAVNRSVRTYFYRRTLAYLFLASCEYSGVWEFEDRSTYMHGSHSLPPSLPREGCRRIFFALAGVCRGFRPRRDVARR